MFYIKTKERRYCKWFLLLETLPSLFTQETLKVFVAYWLALVVELEEEFFFVSFRHRRDEATDIDPRKEELSMLNEAARPSVCSFVCSFVDSSVCSFVHLLIPSFVRLLIRSSFRLFFRSFVRLIVRLFVFYVEKNKSFRKFYVDCQYPVKWKYTISFRTSSFELTRSFLLLMKVIYLKSKYLVCAPSPVSPKNSSKSSFSIIVVEVARS